MGIFARADRTVNRIGYWAGAIKLIYDHAASIAIGILAGGGAVMVMIWKAWAFIDDIASTIGYEFYFVFVAFLAFSFVGVVAAVLLISRAVNGETWAGYSREVFRQGLPEPIDRIALADRLARVSGVAASYYGPWEAEHRRAWNDDTEIFASPNGRGMRRQSTWSVDEKFMTKYSENCLREILLVLALARKCIPLDKSSLWHISHGIRSSHDLHDILQYLSEVEADLRCDQPSLPLIERRR